MARVGIVSASALVEHGRWDAAFFLGDISVEEERIREAGKSIDRANKAIESANEKIAKARRSMQAIQARIDELKAKGQLSVPKEESR